MAHEMGERQRWAWVAAAWSIVAAACLCGFGWQWVLLGSSAAALLYIGMDHWLPERGLTAAYRKAGIAGKLLLAVTGLWMTVLLSWSAAKMELAFPTVSGFPQLSLFLLAMAAWGSRKGSAACAGCSGVLCLILLVLYGILAGFSVPDLHLEWMRPTGTWRQAFVSWGFCLLPAGIWFLPCSPRRRKPCGWVALALAAASAALTAWTAGVLSPTLAAIRPVPLYDLAQSVSILGVMERIEPLLSAAMTMGLFSLLSILACACQEIGNSLFPWNWYGLLACILAGIGVWWSRSLEPAFVVVGCVIMLQLTPLIVVRFFNKSRQNDE